MVFFDLGNHGGAQWAVSVPDDCFGVS